MASTSTDLGSTDDLCMMRPVKINIPTTSDDRSEPQPSPNLPRADLLNGRREDFIKICVPLYLASVNGDWQAAEAILDKRPELVRFAITDNYETALHVAVLAEDSKLMEKFVQNLVNMMEMEDLKLQNKNYNTALCLVAATGCVKKAKIMVSKNKSLLDIPGSQGAMPMHLAALYGKRKMLKYIYSNSGRMTGDFWTDENRGWVVSKCVKADIFDVALLIVEDHPQLASHKPTVSSVLSILCRKTSAFEGIEQNIIWRIIYSIFPIIHTEVGPSKKEGDALNLLRIIWRTTMEMPKPDIDAILIGTDEVDRWKPSSGALFVAAEMGNTRFLVELIRAYPDLIWKVDSDGLSIFHIAVMHRHHDIYNLLYEIGSMKDFIVPLLDRDGNNMLHLVGRTTGVLETLTASQASLLIQRELLWFKEVEQMLPPSYRQRKNKENYTPYELFYKRNKSLVRESLTWVDYSTLVGTLIITIAFAVAFAIPGGYNQDNGFPVFIHERSFIVFIIADAISLFSSSISVLVFLSVIIDRHRTEQHYLDSLPRKLMIGLLTLFISVAALMVTFSMSLFVLYRNGLKWVPILVTVIATMMALLFAPLMQYPLLADLFRSATDATYLFKPKKRMLYIRNPRF